MMFYKLFTNLKIFREFYRSSRRKIPFFIVRKKISAFINDLEKKLFWNKIVKNDKSKNQKHPC